MLKFKDLTLSKRRFYLQKEDGSAILNLDLTKVYTNIDSKNIFYVRGFERTELAKKKFKTFEEAQNYESKWWLDLKQLLEFNNKFIHRLYFNNPSRLKLEGIAITRAQQEFFQQNQKYGYHL
jgi:hypothetical protein